MTRLAGSVSCRSLAWWRAPRPADARPAAGDIGSAGLVLGGLTRGQETAGRPGRMCERSITGYRAGHSNVAVCGEPRPEYDTTRPLKLRYRAKAKELGVADRTIERWVAAFR